jgi:hypothetical protein
MAQGLWGWNAGSRITEFLNQQLPIFEFYFGARNNPRPKPDPAPLVVHPWNCVVADVNNFVDSLDGRPRLSQYIIQLLLASTASKADLACQMRSMIAVIGRNFFDEDSGFNASFERVVGSSSQRDGLDDARMAASLLAEGPRERTILVARLRGNPIFAVEMKLPSAFRTGKAVRAPSLVQNYREWSNAAFNSDGSLAASNPDGSPTISAFCAVQQLYGYLHKLNLNFGVISSLDLTYLVKRDGLELSISEHIKWDSGNLVATLGFLIHLAAQAHATTSHVGKRTLHFCFLMVVNL